MEYRTTRELPGLLGNIYKPPTSLNYRGDLSWISNISMFITIVGPRKPSAYAKKICVEVVQSMKDLPVCIVSGLAYGIDCLAHRTALENNIRCIAFPGSGIEDDSIYPRGNLRLAKEIISKGGALMCEWPTSMHPAPWTFVARNRLMAGISHATIIVEAGEKSGTLITARYALEEGRDIYVVPGDTTRPKSYGSNSLLDQGAHIILNVEDLLIKLGLK